MKQYKHNSGATIYTEEFKNSYGSLLFWSDHNGRHHAFIDSCAMRKCYNEYKEPVTKVQYAHIFYGKSTVWHCTPDEDDNIKVTFTDGVITKVEVYKMARDPAR